MTGILSASDLRKIMHPAYGWSCDYTTRTKTLGNTVITTETYAITRRDTSGACIGVTYQIMTTHTETPLIGMQLVDSHVISVIHVSGFVGSHPELEMKCRTCEHFGRMA